MKHLPEKKNHSRKPEQALWADQSLSHKQPITKAAHWCMLLVD